MKNDYIPLAQTSSGEPWTPADLEAPAQARSRSLTRRRVIFGSLLVIVLLAFYFIVAEWVEDSDLDYTDVVPDYHAAYIPFEPPRRNASFIDTTRLTPTQELPDDCRDAYMSSGSLCFDPVIEDMDIIWTWVNGSDPLLQKAKLKAESEFAGDDPYRPKASSAQARQYRSVPMICYPICF